KASGGFFGAAKYIAGGEKQSFAVLAFVAAHLARADGAGIQSGILQKILKLAHSKSSRNLCQSLVIALTVVQTNQGVVGLGRTLAPERLIAAAAGQPVEIRLIHISGHVFTG